MSQENVEVVERMLEAFHRGDADATLALYDPDVVTDVSLGQVDGGLGRGREELSAIFARWLGTWDEWHDEVEEVRDLGGPVLVVSVQRGRGKGSGIEVESRYAVLYEIRNRMITRLILRGSAAQALEVAGLAQ